MPRSQTVALCVLAALASVATVTRVHADPCDALYAAGIKTVQTPHHLYSTTTLKGGQPRTGEAIFDGKSEYLLLQGKWRRSATPQQAMVEAAQEKLKTHPDTCTRVGEQTAGGQAVIVYRVHNKEMGTEQSVRILESNGLMQGGTLSLPGGSTVEIRYEYANVHAPAGVP